MSNGITIEIVEQVYDLQLITDKITTVEIFDFAVAGDVIPASLFTDGPGNLIVSAAAADPRQLDNVTSPPTNGYVLTWDDTESLKMKFKASGAAGEITLTNKSGGTVNAGDVVIFDKTNASAFTTTTTQGDMRILGVAKETIANNASGKIAMAGIATVNVTGNAAIGAALISSTTPKYAMANGGAKQAGLIGFALTAYAGGATGTVEALLIPAFERAGAAVAVEGVLSLAASGASGSLQCGTAADRLVLALQWGADGAVGAFSAVPTVGGANMTQSGSDIASWANRPRSSTARLFYYKGVGTGSITVNAGTTGYFSEMGCLFIALSGVHASAYIGTIAENILTGTAQSVNCTDAVAGDLVVGFCISGDTTAPPAWAGSGAGQTNRLNSSPVATHECVIIDTDIATGATETMSWTFSLSKKGLSVSIPVHPA